MESNLGHVGNFDGWVVVELGHTLDFTECDVVVVAKLQILLNNTLHTSWLALADALNDSSLYQACG